MQARRAARPAWRVAARPAAVLLGALLAGIGSEPVRAQAPADHAAHHPDASPQGTPSPSGAAMPPAMPGTSEPASEHATSPQAQAPGATLLRFDSAPEERAALASAAEARMHEGVQRMREGLDMLLSATQAQDHAAMDGAVLRIREGLGQYESGLSTLHALAAGAPARAAPRPWLQAQMSLERREPPPLSSIHVLFMVVLVGTVLGLLLLHVARVRRASALLARLTRPDGPWEPRDGPGGGTSASPAGEGRGAEVAGSTGSASAERSAPPAGLGPWRGALEVREVQDVATGIKSFVLGAPGGKPLPFDFLPGQFVTLLAAPWGTAPAQRSYSIASPPSRKDAIELVVQREPDGLVSTWLHHHVRPGDQLALAGPAGVFTFTGQECDEVVLIAGGVGLTPELSILRELTMRGWTGEISLVYACRSPDRVLFLDELSRLDATHPNVHLAVLVESRTKDWTGRVGRIDGALLQEIPHLTRQRIHVCGPQPMVDSVRKLLAALGVPADNVRTESFGIGALPAGRAAATRGRIATASVAHQAVVSFSRSRRSAPLPRGVTVLEAAESVGVPIASACRVGTCGACRVKVARGRVSMAVTDGLSARDREAGFCLACQATSDEDVEIVA